MNIPEKRGGGKAVPLKRSLGEKLGINIRGGKAAPGRAYTGGRMRLKDWMNRQPVRGATRTKLKLPEASEIFGQSSLKKLRKENKVRGRD